MGLCHPEEVARLRDLDVVILDPAVATEASGHSLLNGQPPRTPMATAAVLL